MARFINPVPQYIYDGSPLSGGKLNFFSSATGLRKDTFSAPDLNPSSKNTNPVILGTNGQVPDIFLEEDEAYKLIITDANDVQKEEIDPVSSGSAFTGQFGEWDPTANYVIDDIVQGSNGSYYISIQNNTNQDPVSNSAFWTELELIRIWNTDEQYSINALVLLSGVYYRSLVSANQGNNPATSPNQWINIEESTVGVWDSLKTYALNNVVTRNGVVYSSLSGSNTGNDPETSPLNWRSATPDTNGVILNPGNVFDGYGATVLNNGIGVHDLTFAKSATNTTSQVIQATNGGNSNIVVSAQANSGNTATIRSWLSDTASPNNQYPINITRWCVD